MVIIMARERYLLTDDEDTIHANVITATTKKDKAKNWWYYNKVPLFAIIGLTAVAISIVCSIVFKVRPDYTIAIMNEIPLDGSAIEIVEKRIAQYGEDINGDGSVIVTINNYAVASSSSDNAYDAAAQQAVYAKFAADMSTAESMIWLHDTVGYHSMGEKDGLFENIDSHKAIGDGTMIEWKDVPGLANEDFADYNDQIFTSENMQDAFGRLRLSIREKDGSFIEKKEKLVDYHDACMRLFENLMTDTKTVVPAA